MGNQRRIACMHDIKTTDAHTTLTNKESKHYRKGNADASECAKCVRSYLP